MTEPTPSEPAGPRRRWMTPGRATALALLAVATSWAVWQLGSGATNTRAYADLGRLPHAPPYTPAGRLPAPIQAPFDAAIGLYVDEDYAGSLEALRDVVAADPAPVEPRFYLAASAAMLNEHEQAIEQLRELLGTDSAMFDRASLLLARLYLTTGQKDRARMALSQVEGQYERVAEGLLARMRQIERAATERR